MNLKKFFLFLSVLCFNVNAQHLKTKQSVNTIIQQRNIRLNGGVNSTLGGKSRTTIKVDLPRHTKFWFYSFSTTPDESGSKNLNLAIQLSAMLLDPTGLTKTAISRLQVPAGSGALDVYVLDEANS